MMNEKQFEVHNIFKKGSENTLYAQHFNGQSFVNLLETTPNSELTVTNVTFEPGCRNHWHVHEADNGGGQILLCIAGYGWYQEEGQLPQRLMPGSTVFIPANIKHWHGAAKDSWFSHVAISVPGKNTKNVWYEMVSDDIYNQLEEKL